VRPTVIIAIAVIIDMNAISFDFNLLKCSYCCRLYNF